MSMDSIGKNIRKRRDELGIKQEQLAEMVDLSVSYVGALERGEKVPSMGTFIDIANALKVSTDTLLADCLKDGRKAESCELYEMISELPDKEKRCVLDVVRTLINNLVH